MRATCNHHSLSANPFVSFPFACLINILLPHSGSFCCTAFIGEGVGFANREYLVWYTLFVIFVPYAMLPLPLKWCVVGGTITASCHLAVITIKKLQDKAVSPE